MLRDFGIVTVVDLTVSLLGVMIVLPAALMWAEEHVASRKHPARPGARGSDSGVPRPRLRGLRARPAQTDTT
jgi:hypothetical protein